MKAYIEKIKERYGRKNGLITHYGDCSFYDAYLKVCTCGLHDYLQPLRHDEIKELYPKYEDEIIYRWYISSIIGSLELDDLKSAKIYFGHFQDRTKPAELTEEQYNRYLKMLGETFYNKDWNIY